MLMTRQGDGGEGGPSGLRRNAMEEVWSVFGAAGLYSPWAGMLTAPPALLCMFLSLSSSSSSYFLLLFLLLVLLFFYARSECFLDCFALGRGRHRRHKLSSSKLRHWVALPSDRRTVGSGSGNPRNWRALAQRRRALELSIGGESCVCVRLSSYLYMHP